MDAIWTSPRNSILELLPSELIAKILAILDYRDLVACMQVCKRVFDLIGKSSLLQYHLELGRACMEDAPLSRMPTSERRERLQAHVNAWQNLRWSSCVHLFDLPSNAVLMDVAPGGILTFISFVEYKITFVQPPSNLRGLAMRQWEHTFPFPPMVVALDPSEDILVVLQSKTWRFHFLSLSSGEPHPLAAVFTPSDPPPYLRQSAHLQLLLAGDHVAALLSGYQLKICNWKTGQTVLCIMSPSILSVAFLPENRVLVASTHAPELADIPIPNFMALSPVLAVFNLPPIHMMEHQPVRHIPTAIFALELGRDIVPFVMHLHYRLNAHTYSPEVVVPFFSSPTDQIVALETTNHLRTPDPRGPGLVLPLRHIVLIPIAKLLCHVGATENGRTCFVQWDEWGATGIYRVPAPRPSFYRNTVCGPRFIPRPQSRGVIDVWNFSRAQARLAHLQTPVSETIQCAQREVVLPTGISGSVTAAISEDAIVIHETLPSEEKERVHLLVF